MSKGVQWRLPQPLAEGWRARGLVHWWRICGTVRKPNIIFL
jgi:hypothetical protein